jgi:hypothetical protein
MVPIVGSDQQPAYVRFSAQPKQEASLGNVVIGGPGFVASCKVCKNCLYIAFFFDPEATHPKKS